jgi:hypothetical protein
MESQNLTQCKNVYHTLFTSLYLFLFPFENIIDETYNFFLVKILTKEKLSKKGNRNCKSGFRIRIRIRINLSCWIRIRIRIQIAAPDPNPDPGGQT